MSATKTQRQAKEAYVASANGMKLAGEIITWTPNATSIPYPKVVQALKDASLDESVAKELAARHAFARACRKLSEERIIRQVKDDGGLLHFQFTAEHLDSGKYDYKFETMLVLNKESGDITSDIPALTKLAKEELDKAMEARTASDITRIVQRFFDKEADLFPIRDQGGAYFVPVTYETFLGRIEKFLEALGGKMGRFPITAGSKHGDASVKDAVKSGIAAMIQAHDAAVKSFGLDTRQDTLERAAERIKVTKAKIEAYRVYLQSESDGLGKELDKAAGFLRTRINQLPTAKRQRMKAGAWPSAATAERPSRSRKAPRLSSAWGVERPLLWNGRVK